MTTQMIHPTSEPLSAYAMQTGVVGPYTILSHSRRWTIHAGGPFFSACDATS